MVSIGQKGMTEEHKRKISEACKGKSKNKGKICINNGTKMKLVPAEELPTYEQQGYVRGRYFKDYQPWNKGLKAAKDERVAKMRRKPKAK